MKKSGKFKKSPPRRRKKKGEWDQTQQDFVSLVSHQLRTPLSATDWFLEILLKEIPGKLTPKQREIVEQAHESNHRMIRLVHDLLKTSRLESGEWKVQFKTFSLKKMLDEILLQAKDVIGARNVDVRVDVPPDADHIFSDPVLMQEILENLFRNALKYSGQQKGVIGVRAEILTKKHSVAISISDQGIGIPKSDQKRIFSRFFRSQNAIVTSPSGTGLGLYLSQRMANILGGSVSFVSRVKHGSTFTVEIPQKKTRLGSRNR